MELYEFLPSAEIQAPGGAGLLRAIVDQTIVTQVRSSSAMK